MSRLALPHAVRIRIPILVPWRLLGFIAVLAALLLAIVAQPRVPGHAAGTAPNQDCTLVVPANPLTATGLATPYQLRATNAADGVCDEANPAQQGFVQAGILDPATGVIAIYDPLVITAGTTPAILPSVPTLPAGAIVALWFGDNGTILRLTGPTAAAHCVTGLGSSLFGQVSACNAAAFFAAANARIAAHGAAGLSPAIAPLGTASDGQPCPSVRDAMLVDQDPSDNVTTTYLVTSAGQLAQNTAANRAALASQGAQVNINGSDNKVLTLLDAAIGCTPYEAPDLADGGAMAPAQPLNELQAALYQGYPVDLVPLHDDMTAYGVPIATAASPENLGKTNVYRSIVDQPAAPDYAVATSQQALFCASLYLLGAPRLAANQARIAAAASPFPTVANSLYTFLAQRMDVSVGAFPGMGCTDLLHIAQPPFQLTTDANGVVTGATFAPPFAA